MSKGLFNKCLVDFFIARAMYENNWTDRRFQKSFKEAKKQTINTFKRAHNRVYDRTIVLLDGVSDLTFGYLIPKVRLNNFLINQVELPNYISSYENDKKIITNERNLEEEFVNMITTYITNNAVYKNTSAINKFLINFKNCFIKYSKNKTKNDYLSPMSSIRLADIIAYYCYKENKYLNLKELVSLIYHINLEHFSLWGEWLITEPFYKDEESGFIYTEKIKNVIKDFDSKIFNMKNILEYYKELDYYKELEKTKELEKEYGLIDNYEVFDDPFVIRNIRDNMQYHAGLNMMHLEAYQEVEDGEIVTPEVMCKDINPIYYRKLKRLFDV